jgi:hypothetical protein
MNSQFAISNSFHGDLSEVVAGTVVSPSMSLPKIHGRARYSTTKEAPTAGNETPRLFTSTLNDPGPYRYVNYDVAHRVDDTDLRRRQTGQHNADAQSSASNDDNRLAYHTLNRASKATAFGAAGVVKKRAAKARRFKSPGLLLQVELNELVANAPALHENAAQLSPAVLPMTLRLLNGLRSSFADASTYDKLLHTLHQFVYSPEPAAADAMRAAHSHSATTGETSTQLVAHDGGGGGGGDVVPYQTWMEVCHSLVREREELLHRMDELHTLGDEQQSVVKTQADDIRHWKQLSAAQQVKLDNVRETGIEMQLKSTTSRLALANERLHDIQQQTESHDKAMQDLQSKLHDAQARAKEANARLNQLANVDENHQQIQALHLQIQLEGDKYNDLSSSKASLEKLYMAQESTLRKTRIKLATAERERDHNDEEVKRVTDAFRQRIRPLTARVDWLALLHEFRDVDVVATILAAARRNVGDNAEQRADAITRDVFDTTSLLASSRPGVVSRHKRTASSSSSSSTSSSKSTSSSSSSSSSAKSPADADHEDDDDDGDEDDDDYREDLIVSPSSPSSSSSRFSALDATRVSSDKLMRELLLACRRKSDEVSQLTHEMMHMLEVHQVGSIAAQLYQSLLVLPLLSNTHSSFLPSFLTLPYLTRRRSKK